MGMRRRKRRTRSDEGKAAVDPLDIWELRYHPYTIEGRIEGLARFARGVNRRKQDGRPTYGARALLVVFLVPVVVSVVVFVIDAAFRRL